MTGVALVPSIRGMGPTATATALPYGKSPKPLRADGRVLVIDDDPQVCRTLMLILEARGYDCLTASSAEGAEGVLTRESVDLLLCDVELPGDSGLELVARAATEHPDVAAVMISAHDDQHLVDTALDIGAYGYLTKPFRQNDIVTAVANALHRRDLEQDNRAHRD